MADHGEGHNRLYKTPLTYNHIPALIYYKNVKPQIISKISSQKDLYPGLLHLLNIDFLNTSFGIDIFTKNRPYVLFNHDKKYCVAGDQFLLIFDKNKTYGLFKYKEKDRKDYSKDFPESVKKMLLYGQAQIQTAQYILNQDLQKPLQE